MLGATYMIVFMCLQHVELNVCMHYVTAFYNQLVHLSSAYVLGLGELGSVLHLLVNLGERHCRGIVVQGTVRR